MDKIILTEKLAPVYMRIALAVNDPVRAMRILNKVLKEEPLSDEEALILEQAGVIKDGKVADKTVLYSISRRRNALRRWKREESSNQSANAYANAYADAYANAYANAYAYAYGETPRSGGGKADGENGQNGKTPVLVFNLLKTKTNESIREEKQKELNEEIKTKELNNFTLKENKEKRKEDEKMEKRFIESEEELKEHLKELELEEFEEVALYFFRLRKKRARLSKIVEEVMMLLDHPYGLKAFREVKNTSGFKPINYILAVADRIQKNAEKARTKKPVKDDIQEKAKQIWLPPDKDEALAFIARMEEKGIYDKDLAEALRRRVEG